MSRESRVENVVVAVEVVEVVVGGVAVTVRPSN